MEKFWKFVPRVTRMILVPPTFIFAMVGLRFLLHPAENAAAVGIALTSHLGTTIARVGFGGFPLACSLFTLSCLVSRRRVLTGLAFVSVLLGVLLAVRLFGMAVDGTAAENMRLVRAEAILLTVFAGGIAAELKQRRYELRQAV